EEASVIVCPRCSKDNQDHYKFCLRCGGELPRNAEHQPKNFTSPTPPAGFSTDREDGGPVPGTADASGVAKPSGPAAQFGGAAAAGSAPPAQGSGMRPCAKCGSDVPPSFKFCGTCEHPM